MRVYPRRKRQRCWRRPAPYRQPAWEHRDIGNIAFNDAQVIEVILKWIGRRIGRFDMAGVGVGRGGSLGVHHQEIAAASDGDGGGIPANGDCARHRAARGINDGDFGRPGLLRRIAGIYATTSPR